jgi:hypothetical protein
LLGTVPPTLVGTVSGNFLALFFVDLVLDELGTVDTLRLEAIVLTAQRPKVSLIVTTIDREEPLVLEQVRRGAWRTQPRRLLDGRSLAWWLGLLPLSHSLLLAFGPSLFSLLRRRRSLADRRIEDGLPTVPD